MFVQHSFHEDLVNGQEVSPNGQQIRSYLYYNLCGNGTVCVMITLQDGVQLPELCGTVHTQNLSSNTVYESSQYEQRELDSTASIRDGQTDRQRRVPVQ